MGYNHDLQEIFRRYKGQPIEVITESGMKYCGILVEVDEGGVDIIDCKSRTVHIESIHIEAIVEPRMKLYPVCDDDDCCCCDDDDDDNHCKCCD